MFYLVKTGGLEQSLYVGEMVNGVREGKGVQYFSNGYRYSGNWQANRASGSGKLEYTDGTFYEGTFKENRFVEGVLSFYSGAKFVGTFSDDERQRERFHEGSFIFKNGDILKTTWHNGIPRSGNFITKEGKVFKFIENEKAVFLDEDDAINGKILMAGSTEIYEGGVKEKEIHGKGVIYSSFPHYEEAYYTAGKPNGPFICNYIHGGYCYDGHFKAGQRIGKWKYQTVKGFFYEGEANLKSGKVTFPYLNDDHFIGDVDVQFHNITLLNGTYNFMDTSGKYVPIPVQNITNLHDIPEVRDRKIPTQNLINRFQKSKIVNEEPILNGVQIYNYPDGAYFKGNFNYDFIYIHKKDLLNCFFPSNGKKNSNHLKPLLSISKVLNFKHLKTDYLPHISQTEPEQAIIIGRQFLGKRNGFCQTFSKNTGYNQGFFKDDKLTGFGKTIDLNENVFLGNFIDGLLEGPGIVMLPNMDIVRGVFTKGLIQESKVEIKKKNGLMYYGSISNFKKEGFGELHYTNGFKYIGYFEMGEIDTTSHKGKIITPDNQEFECIYTKVASRDIGILETVSDGEVYIYNNNLGSLKKAQ